MSRAFLAFARTGDPNTTGLPPWPAFDLKRRATMLFDRYTRLEDDPRGRERRTSPLKLAAGKVPLAKYKTVSGSAGDAASLVTSLNAQGYRLAPLGYNSNPYKMDGSKEPQPGDYSQTYVGDNTDTSPYPDPKLDGSLRRSLCSEHGGADSRPRSSPIMRRSAVTLAIAVWVASAAAQPASITEWRLDNLQRLGGVPVQLIGAPTVVNTSIGPAIAFNGVSDGLLLERNPIEGLKQFTIEVLFAADADGPAEQRFLHMQEAEGENRALVELRLRDGTWSLDSYVRHGDAQLTLTARRCGSSTAITPTR